MKSADGSMRRLIIMGAGPGSPDLISPRVIRAAQDVDVLLAFGRIAPLFEGCHQMCTVGSLAELFQLLDATTHQNVGVLVSGSPAVFSVAPLLIKRYSGKFTCEVIGGQSSLEYFFAHLGFSLTQSCLISAHGKSPDPRRMTRILHHHPSVTLTLSSGKQIYEIADVLCKFDPKLSTAECIIGSDLSYETECVYRTTLGELCHTQQEPAALSKKPPTFSDLSILYIASPYNDEGHIAAQYAEKLNSLSVSAPRLTVPATSCHFGRGVDEFIRVGTTPITKPEVRAVILSKLQLNPESVLVDIGAGSGSVSIEACLLYPDLVAVAIERSADACCSLKQNAERFEVSDRITIREEDICEVLDSFSEGSSGQGESLRETLSSDRGVSGLLADGRVPTHIFCGGALGSLEAYIEHVKACVSDLRTRGCAACSSVVGEVHHEEVGSERGGERYIRVVAAAVTLSSAAYLESILRKPGFEDYEMVQISVSRNKQAGSFLIMDAENSIYIASANVNLNYCAV